MTKFEEYKMHINAIKTLVKSDGVNMVTGFFETLFDEYKNLDIILVYGYTPGFNDGDPCTHSQYTTFDGSEITDTVDLYEVLDIDEDESDSDEVIENLNDNLSRDEANQIDKKVDDIDELLERVYYTDFYILAHRTEDGTVKITTGDYYCGY